MIEAAALCAEAAAIYVQRLQVCVHSHRLRCQPGVARRTSSSCAARTGAGTSLTHDSIAPGSVRRGTPT